jgi:hypothetical protein
MGTLCRCGNYEVCRFDLGLPDRSKSQLRSRRRQLAESFFAYELGAVVDAQQIQALLLWTTTDNSTAPGSEFPPNA